MGPTARISIGIIFVLFLLSVFSPYLVPYDPNAIDLSSIRQSPSLKHPLGTDSKGRDMLARVLSGGRGLDRHIGFCCSHLDGHRTVRRTALGILSGCSRCRAYGFR